MKGKSPVLLDSCSDEHIIFERSSFLYILPSGIPSMLVGKDGEPVFLQGMGPITLKAHLSSGNSKRLMSDKAYLPALGDATQSILSTGRIWKMQGIDFKPDGDSSLAVGGADYCRLVTQLQSLPLVSSFRCGGHRDADVLAGTLSPTSFSRLDLVP